MARSANVELRSQRDQLVNVVGMVREIGFDLLTAEKLASDINYRRLLHIVILYTIIALLFVSIILVLLYKLRRGHHVIHIPIKRLLGFSHTTPAGPHQ